MKSLLLAALLAPAAFVQDPWAAVLSTAPASTPPGAPASKVVNP